MNFSTYRFTLDLQKHQSQMSIAAFHYDTAIKLSIGLTDGGVPYYLEDGCIAVLWGTRADGSPISHKCSIENNTRIIYEFNNETAKITGVVNCQIRLYKDGEEIITAPKFIIVVAERLVNDTDILDAEDDVFTHEQLSALDGLFVNESARAEAEKARVEAENVRDGNERLRDEKEQTRIAFENERQTEEAKRVIAETERAKAETARQEGYAKLTEIDNKLDKTTEPYKIYGTGASGQGQGLFPWGYEASGNTMVRRLWDGNIALPLEPTEPKHAAPKQYVDDRLASKVEKTNLSMRLYGTKSDKTDTVYILDKNAKENAVPQRTSTGNVRVPLEPENEDDATSKKYVDDVGKSLIEKQNAIEEKVTNLENLTLTFYDSYIEGSEVELDYEVGNTIQLGAINFRSSYKSGKNIVDPSCLYAECGDIYIEDIDGDGTIHFYNGGQNDAFCYDLPNLDFPPGTYRYVFETEKPERCSISNDSDGYFRIYFDADWFAEYDENGEIIDEFSQPYNSWFRIMLYLESEGPEYSFEEAPSGTVYEPYTAEEVPFVLRRIKSYDLNDELLDTFEIPKEVISFSGYGNNYNSLYFELYRNETKPRVTYENDSMIKDVSQYFTRATIKIQEGGRLVFENDNDLSSLDGYIFYVVRKGDY